jgi:hypothetical protein
MNFFDNGDGTYEQIGFGRVRIRIDSTVAGNYTVTTPWKQYFFTVTQATIDATGGRRVINATEDIGLGPDGNFTGVLGATIGPYVYSQGAPFVTATGSYLGDNTDRPVVGSTFTDPVTGQPANIFRIQGPPGFTTVSTNLFAITGKLYITEPTPTPLTVDKATYALDNTGMQVNAFATTEALSNQTNSALPFPQNFALTGAPSALQLTGTGIPTQSMTTNNPADGKFFTASGLFIAPGIMPTEVTVTNTNDNPPLVKTVPLVDEVVITNASYNPVNRVLSIAASSFDKVAAPALQAFLPGMTAPLGTLSNGLLNVTFPVTDNSSPQPKTFTIPTNTITVASGKGGVASAPVVTFIPPTPQSSPATGLTLFSNIPSPQLAGTLVSFNAAASGGTGTYEYRYWLRDQNGVYTLKQDYSPATTWNWDTTGLPTDSDYAIAVHARSVGSPAAFDQEKVMNFRLNAPSGPGVALSVTPNLVTPQLQGTQVYFTGAVTGGTGTYEYQFWLKPAAGNVASYVNVQPYSVNPTWKWDTTAVVPGEYTLVVQARVLGSPNNFDAETGIGYVVVAPLTPATAVSISTSLASGQTAGTQVFVTGTASGGSGPYEYQFWLKDTAGVWTLMRPFSPGNIWQWDTSGLTAGTYVLDVQARVPGTTSGFNVEITSPFDIQ